MDPHFSLSFFKKQALRSLPVVLIFSSLFFCEMPLSNAITFTWTATNGNWSDPANWDCSGCGNYPGETGNTDDVVISNGTGTITLDVSVTINDLTMPHKTISGTETLTVNGTMNWTRGVIASTLTTGGGSTVNISGSLDKIVNGTLNLGGTTNHSEGKVTTGASAVINNSGSYSMTAGTCEVELGTSSFFNNTGTMDLSMDGTPFSGFSGTLDNDGTITRSGGTGILTIASDFINDGTLNHQTGSRLTLSGSPIEQNGVLTLHGGEELWTRTLIVNSTFTLAAGQTWRIQSGTTFNVAFSTSGNVLFAPSGSGTLGGSGSLTTSGVLTLQVNSNDIILEIPVTVNGDCDMLGTGQKVIRNTLTLNGTTDFDAGNLRIENSGKINNVGTFNYNSSGTVTFNLSPGTSIAIENTGTFNVGVNGSITGSGTFLNGNIFQRNGGTGNLTMSVPITNNGIFEQSTTGTIITGNFTNNGTIQGTGTIDFFTLSQSGTVSPGLSPGTIAFDQLDNGSGSINIELASLASFDQIQVSGAATLSGTLNLSFIGTYEPNVGDEFTIMTCSPCSIGSLTINHPGANPDAFSAAVVGSSIVLTMSQALPVELIDFNAQKKGDGILLAWKTGSETNNYGFEIEHSIDGRAWGKIGFVEGQGNSSTENHYVFLDKNPQPCINYYRLRQIDFDGQFSFSKIKSVTLENKEGDVFKIYPNLVLENKLTIFFKNKNAEKGELILINNIGKIIKKETMELIEKEYAIDFELNNIPVGQYFILWETEQVRWVEKLIVVK